MIPIITLREYAHADFIKKPGRKSLYGLIYQTLTLMSPSVTRSTKRAISFPIGISEMHAVFYHHWTMIILFWRNTDERAFLTIQNLYITKSSVYPFSFTGWHKSQFIDTLAIIKSGNMHCILTVDEYSSQLIFCKGIPFRRAIQR